MERTLVIRPASLIFLGMCPNNHFCTTLFFAQGKSSVCVNDIILYATHIRDESKNVCFRGTVKGAGLVESCFCAVCVILFYVTLDKIDYFVK